MTITAFPINTVLPTALLIASTPFGAVTATNVQGAINQLAGAASAITTLPASSVTNIPSGPITSTNVQNALNELAGLIPAVGPGTDPLALTQGLSVLAANGAIDTNPTNRIPIRFRNITDVANVQPDFSNAATLEASIYVTHGQGTYNAQTQAKTTFSALQMSGSFIGSGQKFLYNNIVNAYGMGDTGLTGGNNVTFSCGPIAGDEAQSWSPVSNLAQQNFLSVTNIASLPTMSVVNTTTTQAITRSKDPQTVTVASAAGAAIGDWLVVGRESGRPDQNEEAVQILSFTPTSITANFRCNHINGTTITPAVRVVLNSVFTIGQDRILVNLTRPLYSAGNVTACNGTSFIGTGTSWSVGMVGGDALQIGAISLDADTYNGPPFDGAGPNNSPLRSWYQILSVNSPTDISVFTWSVAGDGAYRGKGPPLRGSGPAGNYPYKIAQCAKVLRVVHVPGTASATGELILDNASTNWQVGDVIEQAMCPYPDVSGFQYAFQFYTPGGTYRDFTSIRNGGARMWGNAFRFWETGVISNPLGSNADAVAFGNILSIECSCQTIISATQARITDTCIRLPTDVPGISFGNAGGPRIDAVTNMTGTSTALRLYPMGPVVPFVDQHVLSFYNAGDSLGIGNSQVDSINLGGMAWTGYFWLPRAASPSSAGFFAVDNTAQTDLINFERLAIYPFTDHLSGDDYFVFESMSGGTGRKLDMVLKANGVDAIRVTSGNDIILGHAAIATNATKGFLWIASGAGTPTGVPSAPNYGTGRVPMYIDTTNSQLWLYIGGSWKQPKTPAGAALVTWQ